VAHDGLVLEKVPYRLSGNGGGTAGQTKLDLRLDGDTVYPSSAKTTTARPGPSRPAASACKPDSRADRPAPRPASQARSIRPADPRRVEAYLI